MSTDHRGDFLVDVLEDISVKDVPWKQRTTVFQGMALKEIVRVVENRQHYFPVVDKNEGFVGVCSTDDIRGHLYNEDLWELANARDVISSRVTGSRRRQSKKLLGMLRRRDVIACTTRNNTVSKRLRTMRKPTSRSQRNNQHGYRRIREFSNYRLRDEDLRRPRQTQASLPETKGRQSTGAILFVPIWIRPFQSPLGEALPVR
jgi:hypothetical protein